MQTDNRTLYGIKDDTERTALIIWSITVLLASLIGDSVILIATIRYTAIKRHKVIIAVMQHMAVCDLLQNTFRVFPITLALITDRWVVGELLCHVQDNVGWVCSVVTMLLTCALTTLKLVIVKHPFRTVAWSTRLGHKICSVIWLLIIGLYTPVLLVKIFYIRDSIYFSYNDYECSYGYSSASVPTWYLWYYLANVGVINLVSYTTLTVTSALLLVVAKRAAAHHGRKLKWEGLITVLATVGVFLVSYLPMTVVFVTFLLRVGYSSRVWRAVALVHYLNIMANFFVYSITVQSFREFLKLKTSQLLSLLGSYKSELRQPLLPKSPLVRAKKHPVRVKDPSTPAVELQELHLISDSEEGSGQNIPVIRDTSVCVKQLRRNTDRVHVETIFTTKM